MTTQRFSAFEEMDGIDDLHTSSPGGGGRYCHIWAIWVCAAVKGMIFKQFTLG